MLKVIRKIYISLSMAIILCVSTCIVEVRAERSEVDACVTLEKGLGEVSKVCSQANDTCDMDILLYTGSDGVVSFSNSLYSELDMEQKREFMSVALSATQETSLGTQQKNKLYNFIAAQDNTTSAAIKYLKSDASADFVEAKAWLRPFSSPVSTLLGVICLLVFMFISFSALFDCAYLVLPMFQAFLEMGNEKERPFGVSREAWNTMKDIENPELRGRNILAVYFKRRVPSIILCSICLGYIVSGEIYDLMVFFVDAFSSM